MFGYLRWTWNELIISDELITTNAEPSEADLWVQEEVIKSKERSILEECTVYAILREAITLLLVPLGGLRDVFVDLLNGRLAMILQINSYPSTSGHNKWTT